MRLGVLFVGLTLAVTAAAPAGPRAALSRGSGTPVLAVTTRAGIVLVDPRRGERTLLAATRPGDGAPALSPDGRRLAFASRRSGNFEIYVVDLWTDALTRLTGNRRAIDTAPSWSADGRLAWASGRVGAFDVHMMDADGGHKRRLAGGPGNQLDPDWAPAGNRLVYSSDELGDADLWVVSPGGGDASLVADLPGDELRPAWSPDGRRIAFAHAREGRTTVEIVPAAGGEPIRVARGPTDAGYPSWSPAGLRVAIVAARGGARAVRMIPARGGQPRLLAGLGRGDGEPDWGVLAPRIGPPPRAGERLPDLEQRAPRGVVALRVGSRELLGFASAVDNVGSGPFRVRGSRPRSAAAMRVSQVVELADGSVRLYRDVGRLRYSPHPPHYHWHYALFEQYELRRAADFVLVGRDGKAGFCLADHYGHAARRVPRFGPPRFLGDCGRGQRELRALEQGSSPGYTDRYPAFFHGQSVDITGVPPGLYVLVHRANPDFLAHELRYENNAASVLLRLGRARVPGGLREVQVLARCEGRGRCGMGRRSQAEA